MLSFPTQWSHTEEEGNNEPEDEKIKGYPNALLFGSMVHKMCEWMSEEQSAEDVLAHVLAEPMFSELRDYGEEAVRLVRSALAKYWSLLQS